MYLRDARFEPNLVTDSITARDLQECENFCLQAFRCTGFAFRIPPSSSSSSSDRRRNCEIVERSFREVANGYDLATAPDWNVYERSNFASRQCSGRGGGSSGSDSNFGVDFGVDTIFGIDPFLGFDFGGGTRLQCYRRYRADATLASRAIVHQRRVKDANECAAECDWNRERSASLGCGGFAFDSRSDAGPNCFLSDTVSRRDLEYAVERSLGSQVWQFQGGRRGCGRRGQPTNTRPTQGEYVVYLLSVPCSKSCCGHVLKSDCVRVRINYV